MYSFEINQYTLCGQVLSHFVKLGNTSHVWAVYFAQQLLNVTIVGQQSTSLFSRLFSFYVFLFLCSGNV